MDQTAFTGRKRREKLRTPGALGFLGASVGELLERFPLMRAKALRIQARIDWPSQPLRGDPSGQHLEAIQSLALIDQERLDIVSDKLEEHFGRLPAAQFDQE